MDIWARLGAAAGHVENAEVTLMVIGDKQSGKSSIISRLLEQNAPNKPTVALEYLYARKGTNLCHIWEAGGAFNSSARKMAEVPLSKRERSSVRVLVFCIVLDLEHLERFEDIGLRAAKLVSAERKKSQSHGQRVKVLLVANKFDLFSSRTNETKKCVNIFLRALALSMEAHVTQCSNKSESQMLKTKKMLNHLIFNSGAPPPNETDVNKSLTVTQDSWASIGVHNLEKATFELSNTIKQERVDSSHVRNRQPQERFQESKIDSAIEQYKNFAKYNSLVQS